LLEGEYLEAQRLSRKIAAEMQPPRFYLEKMEEVEASRAAFETHPMVQGCLEIVRQRADRFGHGLAHVRKVAVDAGALVIIEMDAGQREEQRSRVLLLSHIAGVLHDISRLEKDHALRGAEEAGLILEGFDLESSEREAVMQAIRNHEAFKPAEPMGDPSMQLLSDALYDADKFRWGPDNFTETVWMMVAPTRVPLAKLMEHFAPSMEGIARISGTFRTPTGREYGPDFIARGLEIGERLCRELAATPAEGEGV
jgi:HD superfamily phosphohydrolase YqeK